MDKLNELRKEIDLIDNDLMKFKCDLIEEDYHECLPESSSILELNFDHQIKRKDSKLSHFSSMQSDDLIFGYFLLEYNIIFSELSIPITLSYFSLYFLHCFPTPEPAIAIFISLFVSLLNILLLII